MLSSMRKSLAIVGQSLRRSRSSRSGEFRLATGQSVQVKDRLTGLAGPLSEALRRVSAQPGQTVVTAEVRLGITKTGLSALVTLRPGQTWVRGVPEGRCNEVPLVNPDDHRGRRTSWFTVVLRLPRRAAHYVVVDAHWGRLTPPVPWDPWATDQSGPFWARHALALPTRQFEQEGLDGE